MRASRQRWLAFLPIAPLILLSAIPATRGVIRHDLATLFATPSGLRLPWSQRGGDPANQALQQAAAANPQDVDLQIAAAASSAGSAWDRVQRLRALEDRFPGAPAVPAQVIRYLPVEDFKLTRVEQYLPSRDPLPKPEAAPARQAQAAALLNDAASRGERLDPDNAFFPLMHACGLFAIEQDHQAIPELLWAGQCSRWDDYAEDERAGRLKTTPQDPVAEMAVWASDSLPSLSQVRATAQMARYEAALAESSGRPAEGMAIRHALMRTGGLMRAQSPSTIDSVVGIAAGAIALTSPGGSLPPPTDPHESSEQRSRVRVNDYCAYLVKIGHPEEVSWVRAEMARSDRVHDIFRRSFEKMPLLWEFVGVFAARTVDVVLLANAVGLLFLSGLASLKWRASQRRLAAVVVAMGLLALLVLALAGWAGYLQDAGAAVSVAGGPIVSPEAAWMGVLFLWTLPAVVVGVQAFRSRGKEFAGRFLDRIGHVGLRWGSALLVVYSLAVLVNLYTGARTERDLRSMMQHEGRYYAAYLGQAWPEE